MSFYKNSIKVIEDTRARLQLKEHKTGFFKNKIKTYELLVNVLVKLSKHQPLKGYIQETLYFVEKAKARTFLDGLHEGKVNLSTKLSPEIREEELKITREISKIQTGLVKPGLSDSKREELLKKLEKVEENYLNLIHKIKRANPEYAGIVYPEPYKLDDIQKKLLSEDMAVIEYFLGKEHSFMFCITKNDFKVEKIASIRQLNESVYAYLKLLSSQKAKDFKGIAASRYLYKELIYPFEDKIKGIKNLIIIPDGYLHYLPFETLVADTSRTRFLVEDYKMSYAPSASSLINLLERRRKDTEKKDLLAFADPVYTFKKLPGLDINAEQILRKFYLEKGFAFYPLKYSGKEVKQIGKLIQKPYRDIFIGEKAREEILKKISLTDYKIIHFATHGLLDEDEVGRSGLVLTLDDDPQEDGFFQVREIYNTRLNADLVVLSACQTGKGKLEKGEGVSGLSRAFLYAGAESVVVSLWNINDKSTALFMGYFYEYLARGESKSQALRLAKLKMQQSKYSHPYHWAAFILIGDFDSPVKISR
jgi:CHAT domain-containing protein